VCHTATEIENKSSLLKLEEAKVYSTTRRIYQIKAPAPRGRLSKYDEGAYRNYPEEYV
jgi:hypothetical protein